MDGGNTNDFFMIFKDDTDGSFNGYSGQTDNFPAEMEKVFRFFIENGRAIYYGSIVPESTVGNLEEVKNTIPLANVIKLQMQY